MRSLARPKILFSFRPPPKQTVRAFFFFRADISRFKSNFSRRCVSARSSGRFAFFEPVRFNSFLPRQSFPERGIFSKSRKPPFPLKRKSFGCPLQKSVLFLIRRRLFPMFFQPAPELKGTSFKSESDWIVESKKIITTEHSPNIAINFLDRRFLQSRLDSAVFPTKNANRTTLACKGHKSVCVRKTACN